MTKKRLVTIIIIAAIIAAISVLVSRLPAPNGSTPDIKNPDAFVIAGQNDIASLDPAYGYDTESGGQLLNIYEPLIKFDGSSISEFAPCLATEWTVSEDGKTYRFKIREGVSFHNGNALTPEDVEYSFERGMVQDYVSGPQWMFFETLFGLGTYTSRTDGGGLISLNDIKSKVEVDGQWVQFNLAAPYEPFLQIMSSYWASVVDMDWCIQNGDWDGTQESYESLNNPAPGSSPIHSIANGTGPFMLESWNVGSGITLIRNDDYWGELASFERIITQTIFDSNERALMLVSGDADAAAIPLGQVQALTEQPGISVYDGLPTLLNQALFFQFDIEPATGLIGSGQLDGEGIPADFFSDVDVRKGFAYAFDWDVYIHDALTGYGEQISSPIIKGIPYYKPDWPSYELDLAKAEQHLRTAWDGQVWENGFLITLVYGAGDVTGKTACEILQSNLFQINPLFKINIRLMGWPDMLAEMSRGGLPMYISGWSADYPDPHNFVFPYMHSQGTFAQGQRYSNEVVDGLIEQAISSNNHTERQMLYDQLAELYYDEVPSIMMAQLLGAYCFRDWIDGFVYNPMRVVYATYAYYLSKGYE
jgi:peptide/nickel transport system substrate-binding protein